MYSLVTQITAHEGAVRSIACFGASFLPQAIVTGGVDAFARVWDGNTQLITSLSHDHNVTSIIIDPLHHYIITGSMDYLIRIYSFQYEEITRLSGHSKGVISLDIHQNTLLSGSWDGSAKVWDLSTFECIKSFEGQENGIHVCFLDEEGKKFVTVSTGEAIKNKPSHFYIRLWDLSTNALLKAPLESHNGSIRAVKKVDNIGFVTSSNDGTIRCKSPYHSLIVD